MKTSVHTWRLTRVLMCWSVLVTLGFTKPNLLVQSNHSFLVNPTLSAVQETATTPLILTEGEIPKKDIKGGETQTFSFALTAGQYAHVDVRWHGMDLDVSVKKPDKTLLFPTSIPVRGSGPIPISVIAEQSGPHTLEVRTLEQVKIAGTYGIVLSVADGPTEAGRARFDALGLMTAGQAEKSKSEAIKKYINALELWVAAQDPFGRAYALQRLGSAYIASKDIENAEKHYQALLELRQSLNDRRSLIYTRREIGQDVRAFHSPTRAIQYYQPALQLARDVKDRRAEAAMLYSIGFANQNIGYMDEALKAYDEAWRIYHEDGDRLNEARTLNAMGGVYNALGDQSKSISFLEQARTIFTEFNDLYRVAIAINNIGLAYDDLGDLQKAKDKYLEALAVFKSLLKNDISICKPGAPSHILTTCNSIANTSDNMGEIFNTTGDPKSAFDIFQQSLPIREALAQPRPIGLTLTHIGYSTLLQGQPEEAVEYCERALAFNQKAEDLRGAASSLTVLGMAHAALNNTAKAFDYYEQALSMHRKVQERRGEGITLNQLGTLHLILGNHEKAVDAYDKALQLWRDVKDEDGETITLSNLAKLERDRGNFSAAYDHIQKAISIVENRRSTLNSQRLLASYFANKQDYYELAIDVQMNLAKTQRNDAFVAKALESSELARGRRLIDALAEARLVRSRETSSMTANNAALKAALDQQAALALKLTAKANARTVMLGRKHTKDEEVALNKEIEKLTAEIDAVGARIKALNPAFASLIKPQPLSAKEIQQQLDSDTSMVEYALGEKRSYAWVVNADSIRGVELPSRKEIENAAGQLTEILKVPESANDTRAQKELRHARYVEAATALSQKILQPMGHLLTKKRLVIVADGALQLIPFNALPTPRTVGNEPSDGVTAQHAQASKAAKRLLIDDHEIVSLPSASVLAVQRRLLENRKPAPHALAILADPIFEPNDNRVSTAKKKKNAANDPLAVAPPPRVEPWKESMRDLGIDKIFRLPFSNREANDISKLVPEGDTFVATGFEANRATAMSPKLAQYRIIHFATHGFMNLEHPELSGIVFSLVDEKGNPQDGFLYLHDIYNLNLPAELVVLSACQTGVGKQIRGEGLIALARGFMYAGASRLVASLWKVDDAATAELMARFYKEMFTNGKRPAEALRDAQLELARMRRFSSPFYWAGFVLQGEWR